MQYIVDGSLSDFQFWSGGAVNASLLTDSELDDIGEQLEDSFGHTPTDTEINDLFWFDFGSACSLVGLEYDEMNDRVIREGDEKEDEEDAE